MLSSDKKKIYVIGIIDMLTEFTYLLTLNPACLSFFFALSEQLKEWRMWLKRPSWVKESHVFLLRHMPIVSKITYFPKLNRYHNAKFLTHYECIELQEVC